MNDMNNHDERTEAQTMKWFYSEYDTIQCLACGAEFNEEIIFMN